MDKLTNGNSALDNDVSLPDAHGRAALLLVESLIHGLIERSVISVADAINIVSIAADTTEEVAENHLTRPAAFQNPLTMLKAISRSLSHDL